MKTQQLEFLTELLETPSPTGHEIEAQRIWADEMRKYTDDVQCDAYGNTWAVLHAEKTDAPTFLLDAHADEIGFSIRQITKEGYARVERLGGTDVAIARGRRIRFLGSEGEVIGVTGNTAIHLRDDDGKVPKIWELYVDFGASSDDELKKMGIRVGSVGVYCDGPVLLEGKRLVCRALDNRLSGFILTEVARKLSKSKSKLAWNIVFANTVQEEVGCIGAKMLAHRINPDAAICLDVTHATDSPGLDKGRYGDVQLGSGPCVCHGPACHHLVVSRLELVADKAKIALQFETSGRTSGTNADSIFTARDGVPCANVSIPLRYMHSPVEMADMEDCEKIVDLLSSFVSSLKAKDSFGYSL